MAKAEIFRVIDDHRAAINRGEKAMLQEMSRQWAASYLYLQAQTDNLVAVIQSKIDAGELVEMEYYWSLDRYQTMMENAETTIDRYNEAAAGVISGEEADAVEIGREDARELINIEEPDDPMWTRVNQREARIMSGMLSDKSPLRQLLDKSYLEYKEKIDQVLTIGISTGQGSAWIASMLADAGKIPLQRALTIARTEVNRTYRQANLETMRSSRAMKGYRRMCYPQTACFACLMMDGEYYDKKEDFSDHPNGKCSAVPVTNHFDPINEPGWERGQDWFAQQSEEDQRRIMGAGRYDLWKNQGVNPRDMVYIKQNPVWGGSPTVKPLRDLLDR